MPMKRVEDLTYEESVLLRARAKLELLRTEEALLKETTFGELPPPRKASEEDIEFIRAVLGDKVEV